MVLLIITIPVYIQFIVRVRQHIRLSVNDDDDDDDNVTDSILSSSKSTLDQNLEIQFDSEGMTGGYTNSYLSELSEKGLNNNMDGFALR